jgi:hypothetical protein
MTPTGFEPAISASDRPQAHVLHRTDCLLAFNYVEIVTVLRARRPRNRGLILGRGNKFYLLRFVQTGPGAYLFIWYWGALLPGVKRLGCEVDHSFQYSAKVKNEWMYTSTPPTLSWVARYSV